MEEFELVLKVTRASNASRKERTVKGRERAEARGKNRKPMGKEERSHGKNWHEKAIGGGRDKDSRLPQQPT